MPRYIAVAGTHGVDQADDWALPTSTFARHLRTIDWHPMFPENPYEWDTAYDGLWGKNTTWRVSGQNLYYRVVPPLAPEKRIPPEETYILAFSNGCWVAVEALAFGLKARGLITVCPPHRADMRGKTLLARRNVDRWINLHGDWRDIWATLGSIGDGQVAFWKRRIEVAENILVPGGHGKALRDENEWPKWEGWLEKIR